MSDSDKFEKLTDIPIEDGPQQTQAGEETEQDSVSSQNHKNTGKKTGDKNKQQLDELPPELSEIKSPEKDNDKKPSENIDPEMVEELIMKYARARKDLQKEKNSKLRLAADLENHKKRHQKNLKLTYERARDELLFEFLPVFDHLEMAMAHTNDESSLESLKEGVDMIIAQFKKTLQNLNIDQIDALGKQFNPKFHEAMSQEESDEHEAGTVIRQWNKGYKFGDKLIRPARVVVAKGGQQNQNNQEKQG
ncbi:MAG: nucleotide exchange factor GrpE [Deltaproteobacteria bacterium]|jgi:molecular chaperone GrpE|nr:nucleotide exchange factor GrpE [Deltaproteobacteria bacterium]